MQRTHQIARLHGTIHAARQNGLWRIANSGWSQNLFGKWSGDQEVAALCLAAYGETLLAGINGGVAISVDGGESWDAIPFRLPAPLVTCLLHVDDSLLAGTFADGVFRSSDGGKSWQAVNHGLFDHSVNCLATDPRGETVFAGTSTGIYYSVNGGRLWHDLDGVGSGDETVIALAADDDGALYAGCESHGLLRIRDGNAEKIRVQKGAVNGIVCGDGWLAAQIDDRVMLTRDNGNRWTRLAKTVDCMAKDDDGLLLAYADSSVGRQIPNENS